mmetsp:Transcript_740/g.916  ORF Transcript_740/g.916 Transcript_740/m.916 type:complete len:86 (-) Transcript_740:252-509(-)
MSNSIKLTHTVWANEIINENTGRLGARGHGSSKSPNDQERDLISQSCPAVDWSRFPLSPVHGGASLMIQLKMLFILNVCWADDDG